MQPNLPPEPGAAAPAIAPDDLLRAAASTRYDDYLTRHGASLIDLYATLSPDDARQLFLDDETLAGVSGSSPMQREDRVRVVLAFGRWLAVGAPITRLSQACPREQVGADETLRAACLAIGRLVLRDADTAIALAIGELVIHRASTDPIERAAVLLERRARLWRSARDSELWGADPHLGINATWLADWRRLGELGAQRARLERAGVALEPPAGWQPQQREMLDLR